MNVSEGKIILADSLEFWQETNYDAYFIARSYDDNLDPYSSRCC